MGNDNALRMLTGWKEIVAHTGISKSTLKRWADKIGFPLHRVVTNGMIYAFPHEIDEWWRKRRVNSNDPM